MFVYPKTYDVIVIGAGHAGVEAALAASRMGCETLMLTINADTPSSWNIKSSSRSRSGTEIPGFNSVVLSWTMRSRGEIINTPGDAANTVSTGGKITPIRDEKPS